MLTIVLAPGNGGRVGAIEFSGIAPEWRDSALRIIQWQCHHGTHDFAGRGKTRVDARSRYCRSTLQAIASKRNLAVPWGLMADTGRMDLETSSPTPAPVGKAAKQAQSWEGTVYENTAGIVEDMNLVNHLHLLSAWHTEPGGAIDRLGHSHGTTGCDARSWGRGEGWEPRSISGDRRSTRGGASRGGRGGRWARREVRRGAGSFVARARAVPEVMRNIAKQLRLNAARCLVPL